MNIEGLKNKVVLVTGGGRGLGEALSLKLAESGADVIVADVKADLAERTVALINKQGGTAFALPLDISDDLAAKRAVNEVLARKDRIDILINNAGTDKTVSIEEMEVADFDRIIATNLRGPFVLSKLVLPVMREQGGGQILNVISTAAKRVWANASAYHASKWGLLGFSHALHVEARPLNIKVTALVVGGMRTPFLLDRFPDIDVATLQDPADVAEIVRSLLASPAGSVLPEVMVLPMRETSWP